MKRTIIGFLLMPLLIFGQSSYVYYSFNDDPWTFNRRDTDGTNPLVIYEPTTYNVFDAAMDASIEKVYFHERSSNESWIYQSDYDGSSKITVKNSTARYYSIAAGDGYIFYSYQDDPWSVRRCDSDGTNDIQLYQNPSYGSIIKMGYDAENNYLYCYEYNYDNANNRIFRINNDGSNLTAVYNNCPPITSVTAGAGYFYYQCNASPWNFSRRNFDGSSETLIYTPPTGLVRACGYDAIYDKLYFYDHDGNGNRYFYKSDPDGSNRSTFFSGFTQDINCVAVPCINPSDITLPITLTSFTAEVFNATVELIWRTESETDNSRFIIYRNDDVIASIEGSGTTSEPHTYNFTDNQVIPGNTYTYVLADMSYANNENKHTDNAVTISIPNNIISQDCVLGNNYPNPFNPTTTIGFEVREQQHVTLQVFDIGGHLITTLIDGVKEAGYWEIIWNGGNHSSGIYVYRFQAGEHHFSKKMVLMK